jgi:hypothetical protein
MSKKFTFFASSKESPEIVPASRSRDWMDETSQRFAYRCLPLAMANAHGWVLLNPVEFTAIWDGGTQVNNVQIFSEDPNHIYLPKSMFGYGTITWHSGGIFQTPKGISLWLAGPPNHIKNAIQPLNGVVETDWSPYSFTMNWKLTQPNRPVTFKKGEPFCFLMPIDTSIVEGLEPEIKNLREEENLYSRFSMWSKMRDAFSKKKREKDPEALKQGWQKLYFHGKEPDGSIGNPDHRTKVKAKPFKDLREEE